MSYHLPYSGSYTFQQRISLSTANLAVALPKSMKFAAAAGASFQPLDDSTAAPNICRKEPATIADTVLHGFGEWSPATRFSPRAGEPKSSAESAVPPATDTRPGIGLGAPIDTPDPLDKYKWWLLSGLGLILVIGAAFFLRSKGTLPPVSAEPEVASSSARPTTTSQTMWLAALKDQMFLLETERIEGKLTETDYLEQKAAFEIMIKRALTQHTE